MKVEPVEPNWLRIARSYMGIREIKGPKHSSVIAGWLSKLNAWWHDDETPWCGTFCAAVMTKAGHPIPRHWMRAKDWLNWGSPINGAVYGCIVVFQRQGGGHVGFVVGEDANGRILVIGGNQGDMVKISPFDQERIVGFRIPKGYAVPIQNYRLPIAASAEEVSKNEA